MTIKLSEGMLSILKQQLYKREPIKQRDVKPAAALVLAVRQPVLTRSLQKTKKKFFHSGNMSVLRFSFSVPFHLDSSYQLSYMVSVLTLRYKLNMTVGKKFSKCGYYIFQNKNCYRIS